MIQNETQIPSVPVAVGEENENWTLIVKPGFHIIAGIVEKLAQGSHQLYGNQILSIAAIPAIAAIRIAGTEPGSISAIVAIEIQN